MLLIRKLSQLWKVSCFSRFEWGPRITQTSPESPTELPTRTKDHASNPKNPGFVQHLQRSPMHRRRFCSLTVKKITMSMKKNVRRKEVRASPTRQIFARAWARSNCRKKLPNALQCGLQCFTELQIELSRCAIVELSDCRPNMRLPFTCNLSFPNPPRRIGLLCELRWLFVMLSVQSCSLAYVLSDVMQARSCSLQCWRSMEYHEKQKLRL